jgi:hypothetical protein
MAIETLFAQPDHEVEDAKDNTASLRDFGKHAVALRNLLYQSGTLNEAELLFMENHLQVLEMTHLWWKRKHSLAMRGMIMR